jgi:hypothetical protein
MPPAAGTCTETASPGTSASRGTSARCPPASRCREQLKRQARVRLTPCRRSAPCGPPACGSWRPAPPVWGVPGQGQGRGSSGWRASRLGAWRAWCRDGLPGRRRRRRRCCPPPAAAHHAECVEAQAQAVALHGHVALGEALQAGARQAAVSSGRVWPSAAGPAQPAGPASRAFAPAHAHPYTTTHTRPAGATTTPPPQPAHTCRSAT